MSQQPIKKTSFLQMVGLSLLVSVLASCGGPPSWVEGRIGTNEYRSWTGDLWCRFSYRSQE